MSQDPFPFHGTVAENVRQARPEIDREAVIRAATVAGAREDLLEREGLSAALWKVHAGEVKALPDSFLERVERRADELGE